MHCCRSPLGDFALEIVLELPAGFLYKISLDEIHTVLPQLCQAAGSEEFWQGKFQGPF